MTEAYLAIDIETTGLNPFDCQVLEIGAVFDDPNLPVMECPSFEVLICNELIVGEPYAINLNTELIRLIAAGGGATPSSAMRRFCEWLFRIKSRYGIDKFNLLGKNVAGFDLQFLKRLPKWPAGEFSHRCLDVGSMYATSLRIPSQSELAKEYLDDDIPGAEHRALHDARTSLALARWRWNND